MDRKKLLTAERRVYVLVLALVALIAFWQFGDNWWQVTRDAVKRDDAGDTNTNAALIGKLPSNEQPLPDPPVKPASVVAAGASYAGPALTARLPEFQAPTPAQFALGERIATQGLPEHGVVACAGCHGTKGEGTGPQFPRLAAQPGWYLYKQLSDYASGAHAQAIMSAFAKGLSDDERVAVAMHYASQIRAEAGPKLAQATSAQRARGLELLELGDNRKGLQGCTNCHGFAGSGEPPGVPALLHQSPDHVRTQLLAWRTGERRNDPQGMMQAVVARLDDADIEALAAAIADPPPLPSPDALETGAP